MRRILLLFWLGLAVPLGAQSDEFENAPIRYSLTDPTDSIAKLKARLARGEASFDSHTEQSLLRDLLRELRVPVESQVLVFSKTSLQRDRITPARPRALYFSEDFYVGWVQGGNLELISVDSQIGPIFYLVEVPRAQGEELKISRSQDCLSCHANASTEGVPGMMVRSLYPDTGGLPILSAGGSYTDQASPIAERWGGWYVTGKSGGPRHMGNRFYRESKGPVQIERDLGENPALASQLNMTPFLSEGSDIVALMVLEHQCTMHNLLTAASFATRQALHRNAELIRALGEPEGSVTDTTRRIIASHVEKVLAQMLFREEFALPGGVEGSERFQTAFQSNARKSKDGRSLKDFQLHRRMFKHRCSYMIYSHAFDALPVEFKEPLLRRLWKILREGDEAYPHLPDKERERILAILRETKPDLPAYWRAG